MLAAKTVGQTFSLCYRQKTNNPTIYSLLFLPPVPALFPCPSPSTRSRLLRSGVLLLFVYSSRTAPPPPTKSGFSPQTVKELPSRALFALEVIFFLLGMRPVRIGVGKPSGFFFLCTPTPTVTQQPRASPAETEQTVIAIDCCCAEDVFSLLGLLRGLVSLGEG